MNSLQNFMQNPQLDGSEFFWPGNDIGFLLIHGFTATTTEVLPLAKFLHEKGYTISAPLLPGHNTTPEDLNLKKWSDWAIAVEEKYRQLQSTCRVVFVGGESMGGLLSLYLAKQHSEIAGILLYAPAIKIRSLGRATLASYFSSLRWKKGGDESMPWKGYRVVPLKASRQLSKLRRKVVRFLPAIKAPVIIFQGRLDRSLELDGAKLLHERLGSQDKTLLWFDNSQHCILLDREFDRVAEASLEFIQQIISTLK